MKRKVLLFLTLWLAVLLTACGNTNSAVGSDVSAGITGTGSQTKESEKPMKQNEKENARLLYMGQGSIRITSPEGKVIYIDPYVGDGYEPAADLILITHGHSDHNNPEMIKNRNPDCKIITWKEALKSGEHQTFDVGFIKVEATEAGYNRNHDVNSCVGYILTLSDGVSVYISGDTSTTKQMSELSDRHIDYAFFCCDGIYNMDIDEAAECARLVGAKHNIPYHVIAQSGRYFDRARAEKFAAPNRLIIDKNEEIELVKAGG